MLLAPRTQILSPLRGKDHKQDYFFRLFSAVDQKYQRGVLQFLLQLTQAPAAVSISQPWVTLKPLLYIFMFYISDRHSQMQRFPDVWVQNENWSTVKYQSLRSFLIHELFYGLGVSCDYKYPNDLTFHSWKQRFPALWSVPLKPEILLMSTRVFVLLLFTHPFIPVAQTTVVNGVLLGKTVKRGISIY